jgi:hypothetical protein
VTSERSSSTLTMGADVIAQDGEKLGTIKEVRGGAFKVDAKMQPDYWLRTDCVVTNSMGQVTVAFPKDRLGEFKMGEPDEMDAGTGRMTDYRATDTDTTPRV